MSKVKRPLGEIEKEIKEYEDAIKLLRKEIELFRSECPHPENFRKVDRTSSHDEYGSTDGYFVTTSCFLCGHKDHKTEEVVRSRYV